MYCPSCGNGVSEEGENFCRKCGFDISLLRIFMANPSCVKGASSANMTNNMNMAGGYAGVMDNSANISRSSAGKLPATEIPSEEPIVQIPARPDMLIRNTRAMYLRINQVMPAVIKDALYKVKCSYCGNVFSYYHSNTIIHRNFPGGYVDCPCCRNHLAHNKDLAMAEFDVNLSDYPGI